MTKVLLTADLHLRDKPPRSCTEEYLPELFSHLIYIGRFLNEGLADVVVFAGDIFDIKNPRNNSHKLVQGVIEILRTYRIPPFIVPGNHDMSNDSFDSVFETQPLGVLYRSGAAKLLSGWADKPMWKGTDYSYLNDPTPSLPIYGVPWLAEYDTEDGFEREEAVSNALEGLMDSDVERYDPVLVVCHAPFFPPGKESPYENYPTPRFASKLYRVYSGSKSVFYGHIHEHHGIYDVDGVKFANAGALSRGSLTESNVNRPIQLTLWDSDTNEFEIFPIPHLPSSRIYKIEEISEEKENKLEVGSFLSDIGTTTLQISTRDSILEHSRKKGASSKVIQVIKNLLDKVER